MASPAHPRRYWLALFPTDPGAPSGEREAQRREVLASRTTRGGLFLRSGKKPPRTRAGVTWRSSTIIIGISVFIVLCSDANTLEPRFLFALPSKGRHLQRVYS